METLASILTFIIVIVAVLISFAVMMQPSKSDGGLGGLANTGSSSDSVLGANRNEFLSKASWVMCVVFIVCSLSLLTIQAKLQRSKIATDEKSEVNEILDGGVKDKTPQLTTDPEAEKDKTPK